jgi:hypothetical protein
MKLARGKGTIDSLVTEPPSDGCFFLPVSRSRDTGIGLRPSTPYDSPPLQSHRRLQRHSINWRGSQRERDEHPPAFSCRRAVRIREPALKAVGTANIPCERRPQRPEQNLPLVTEDVFSEVMTCLASRVSHEHLACIFQQSCPIRSWISCRTSRTNPSHGATSLPVPTSRLGATDSDSPAGVRPAIAVYDQGLVLSL